MREEDLIKDGWEKRGVYSEPRLSEICELYSELGYEVLVISNKVADNGECKVCYDKDNKFDLKTVFTKKVKK